LIGGAGNDLFYGEGGDDILLFGEGFDQLYGGTGSDQFVINTNDGLADKIYDFVGGVGGDILNVTDILSGFDPLSDAISDFVQLVNNGDGDTEVQIDTDGVGGDFTTAVVFEGGINDTLADLINNGNLVADQSVVV